MKGPVLHDDDRPSDQRCDACGRTYDIMQADVECPSCGGLLELRHPRPSFDIRNVHHLSGVWRYEALLLPGAGTSIVSYPEGNTPLLSRARISEWTGCVGLQLKHEGLNPTGSFKDRGMTVAVTQARRVGAPAVACASTGNTSASLAAYAAHAGLPALVFVPAGQVAMGKLTQTIAYGARTLLVRGDFDACLALVRQCTRELGIYLANSINPFRIEGQKTIAFELLAQRAWHAPDYLVLPAGNLGNVSAFGKALREALALGWISRLPRLVAVQAAGAAPFARSFDSGFDELVPVKAETVATAIRIGDPASYDRAVRAIRETNGLVLRVTDSEILEAKRQVDAAGVGCEPASAASVAGVRQLVQQGVIAREDSVVAVLTGHILKDPGALASRHEDATRAGVNAPIEIDADIAAVARLLKHTS